MAPLWNPQEVVTEDLACQLIEEQFPQLKPVKAEVIGQGFDNTVFRVNNAFIFRFPRRKVAVELLETENRILPEIVHKLPIPIPNPTFKGTPSEDYPWPFTGYPIVRGATPGLLSNKKKMGSIEDLAKFLKELHRFPVNKAESLQVPFDEINRLDIENRRPKLKENLQKASDLGLFTATKELEQFINSVEPYNDGAISALVHGDLHTRNLLVDEKGKISGIIDWGDTHIGNPAVDLSIVYSFIPPEGREAFFNKYGRVEEKIKNLAKFKAIYTTALLLLYADDTQNQLLIEECKEIFRQLP